MEHLGTSSSSVLPAEFEKIRRIRDLWSNHLSDDDIRNVLNIGLDEWQRLVALMKIHLQPDNFVEFLRFSERSRKRSKHLELSRNTAEAEGEVATAAKCIQIEAEIDRSNIEVGQKLGVISPEVLEIKGELKHNVALATLFAHLTPQMREETEDEIAKLAQDLITSGFLLNDSSKPGTGEKS